MGRKGGDWLARETEIRALRLSGWPVLDVAAELEVVPQWVVKVCAGLGVATGGAPISESRRTAAEELLRAGATVDQVRKQLRLGTSVIARIVAALGLSPRRNSRAMSPEKKARALAMLRAGATHIEVVRTVGMSGCTVWKLAKEAGVRRGPTTPPAPPEPSKADRLALLQQRAEARRGA